MLTSKSREEPRFHKRDPVNWNLSVQLTYLLIQTISTEILQGVLFPHHLDDNLMNVEHSVMWKFIGYDRSTQVNPVPLPFCPPLIAHSLFSD